MSLKENIYKLSYYLSRLPTCIPKPDKPKLDFRTFELDPEWVENIGSRDGAFNRQMEVYFGSRANGPIILSERGLGIEALASVLSAHLKEFPTSFYLEKWVADILTAVYNLFKTANLPVSC